MIPQHFSVYVANSSLYDASSTSTLQQVWEAELDIERGLFTNTSTFYVPNGNEGSSISEEQRACSISLTWMVHREMKDVMALHMKTTPGPALSATSSCSVQLQACAGEPTDQIVLVGSDDQHSVYQTTTPEVPNGDILYVFSYHDVVPSSISIFGASVEMGEEFLYLANFQSTAWVNSSPFASDSHSHLKTVAEHGIAAVLTDFQSSVNIRKQGLTWPVLLSSHVAAWQILWESGIEVSGNTTIAASINASLYYIHSAVDALSPWSISPGGLSKNSYAGHVFWDCETWVLPALAPFYPDLVLAFEEYRLQRLPAALERARARGFSEGAAMMPWESAYTGMDVTPVGNYEGSFEIHVTADIPLAMRSIYYWTGNVTWLEREAWPVIAACSQYLAERASCVDQSCDQYSYMNVQPPDEKAGIVNASVYTNAAAAELLAWVASKDPQFSSWTDLANRLIIPLSTELYAPGSVHPEYEGYDGEPINQADAVLLQFPLQFEMSDTIAFNDLQYYAALTSVPGETKGYYTGDSSYSIAYMMLHRKGFQDPGDNAVDLKDLADAQFQQAFEHIDLSSFFVWKEKVDGGHLNFLTGAGGFLQNCVYGYAGLVVGEGAQGLMVDAPLLPPGGVTDMKLRGVQFRGSALDLWWKSSSVQVQLLRGEELDAYVSTSSSSSSSSSSFAEEWKHVATLTADNSQLVVSSHNKLKLV
jgi:hypothetical protein